MKRILRVSFILKSKSDELAEVILTEFATFVQEDKTKYLLDI